MHNLHHPTPPSPQPSQNKPCAPAPAPCLQAMLNFLSLLGWNDGTEQEIYTPQELQDKFSLERITKSAAVFDKTKLSWMNGGWAGPLSGQTGRVWDGEGGQELPGQKLRQRGLLAGRGPPGPGGPPVPPPADPPRPAAPSLQASTCARCRWRA